LVKHEDTVNKHFKANERELVKVATFFKKQSRKLIDEGKLGEEHRKVEEAVDKFVAHMESHANARATILDQREALQKLVKDDAECPSCHKRDMLKYVSVDKNDKGWKSNRYKCRRCNIEFTWNRPNNPWDMIQYIQEVMTTLRAKASDPSATDVEKQQIETGLESMQGHLDKLKPVIDAHDAEFNALQSRDEEMEKLIHEFKNSLLIEKIKMDTWENKNR
jgi:peptidoglycan hydrolase CwlO-like protein